MIKLVAIDIDGTLVGEDLRIPEETRVVIGKILETGCIVTLATGRMFQSALPFAKELLLSAKQPLICYNGAMTRRINGEFLSHIPLEKETVKEVVTFGEKMGWTLNLYYEDELYVKVINDAVRDYVQIARVAVHEARDLVSFGTSRAISKILVVGTKEETDQAIVSLTTLLGSKAQVLRSRPRFIEITHERATKGEALGSMARQLGLSMQEVMAIGDSENDRSMLEAAGLGIAVKGASLRVQKSADYVAESVSAALLRYVL